MSFAAAFIESTGPDAVSFLCGATLVSAFAIATMNTLNTAMSANLIRDSLCVRDAARIRDCAVHGRGAMALDRKGGLCFGSVESLAFRPLKVLVLGGGVVGLAAGYFLARDDHEVAIVERNSGVGLETSYANGGQLSYSYVAPLAGPGVLPKIPPWLLRRDAPLRFRPTLDWPQWRWCLEFVLACTRRQADLTTRRLLALAYFSRALMHRFVDEERVDFDYARSGKLVVHSNPESFAAAKRLTEYQASLGSEQEVLDADACVEREPALRALRRRIVGGIYTPSEDSGDCYRLCLGLERLLRARGAQFYLDTEIRRVLRWRDRIFGIETSA